MSDPSNFVPDWRRQITVEEFNAFLIEKIGHEPECPMCRHVAIRAPTGGFSYCLPMALPTPPDNPTNMLTVSLHNIMPVLGCLCTNCGYVLAFTKGAILFWLDRERRPEA